MQFRPCIDIHNGKVKQIIGGSLKDAGSFAEENFVSEKNADWFAGFYLKDGLKGGHIILLNKEGTEYYEQTKAQAMSALQAAPGSFQIGGGIHPGNAEAFLNAGASHVIVTSYVFSDGMINYDHLTQLHQAVGKEHLTLDLSCRKREDGYYIVTDRWQKFTDTRLDAALLGELSSYCSEYLVHAVDVEGKQAGPDRALAELLADFAGCPITYAGGIGSYEDLWTLKSAGKNRLDVTIGSALDLFGGKLSYEQVLSICADS